MALVNYSGEVLFLLVLIGFVTSQDCFNATIQNDRYMEHQVFRKIESPSLYDCASECLVSSVCLSFAFEHKTRTCFLNGNNSAHVSISSRSGFDFSDILPWNKALSGPCVVMSCPMTSSCQLDRHGRATCAPEPDIKTMYVVVPSEFTGCGNPPDVPFARVTYGGHYQGAVARYVCEKDYTVCHQRKTSVCQSSGEWENVTGLCRRFRWINPVHMVNSQYDLPCGPQSNFSVLILATPTTTNTYSMSLKIDDDVTFHASFRHGSGGDKIIINTKFRGRWDNEQKEPFTFTVGKESEILISLYNGVYKLVVGDVVMKLPERQPGILPDKVSVLGDIRISSMEISM